MIRTQIQLTEEQHKCLKEIGHRNHESLAELIRRAVDRLLIAEQPERAALYRQAETVVGKYTAQSSDIATEHDRYLDDAYSA
ncbi:MAG: CopG family transcriptional regulator [Gammaproteobacteria bacterium]